MTARKPARVRIKICGITNASDASMCAEAGADALGLVLWSGSPRGIAAREALEIARDLPPFVSRVGVFVNETVDGVIAAVTMLGLDWVQLSGDEDRTYCRTLAAAIRGTRIMKTFRITSTFVPETAFAGYEIHAHHLDAEAGPRYGGTGNVAPWDVARRARGEARACVLAGGLTPSNVQDAIARVGPWAVDVASGVEREPGVKEPDLVRAFIAAVLDGARREVRHP